MMSGPFEDPTGLKIMKAFTDPSSIWRTPGGIARVTGFSINTVTSYIHDHPNFFSTSRITPNGTHLYSINPKIKPEI